MTVCSYLDDPEAFEERDGRQVHVLTTFLIDTTEDIVSAFLQRLLRDSCKHWVSVTFAIPWPGHPWASFGFCVKTEEARDFLKRELTYVNHNPK